MYKSKSEGKNVIQLLQEKKKHILIPESILSDLNNISSQAKVDQQKITTEILKLGIPKAAKKYHLVSKLVQEN